MTLAIAPDARTVASLLAGGDTHWNAVGPDSSGTCSECPSVVAETDVNEHLARETKEFDPGLRVPQCQLEQGE
jgi:hypothetical protein